MQNFPSDSPAGARTVAANPIILYDGVCALCNRINQFTLKRDKQGVFRFAALQSTFAREILLRHGADPDELDTFYVVTNHGETSERLRNRSRAALFVLRTLGGFWRVLSVIGILPTFLLDLGYRLIANNRYRLFGKHDQCVLPDPKWEDRFIAAK